MAQFNPDVPEFLGSNMTGYSQLSRADKGLGSLFGSLADVVSMAAKNKVAQKQIDTNALSLDVQKGIDSIGGNMETLLPPAAQPTATNPTGQPVIDSANPPDFNAGLKKMANLQTALKQGTIPSDSWYSGQMLKLSKDLKVRYPHLADKVDMMIAQLQGVNSANSYRKDLLQEQARLDAAASSEEKRKAELMQDEHFSDPFTQKLYESVTGGKFDPSNFDYNAMSYAIGASKYEDLKVDKSIKMLNLADKQDATSSRLALQTASLEATQLRDKMLVTGLGDDKVQSVMQFTKLNEAVGNALKDGSVDPIEHKAIMALVPSLEMQLNNAVDTMLSRPEYTKFITSQSDKDQIRNVVLNPLNTIKTALTNQDFGILNAVKRDAELRKLQHESKLMNENPLVDAVSEAGKIWGQQAVEDAMRRVQTDPATATESDKAIASTISSMLLQGKSITEVLHDGQKDITNPAQVMSPLKGYLSMLSQPGQDKTKVEKATKSLFGNSEMDLLKNNAKANPEELFNMMMNPGLWENVKGTSAAPQMYKWGLEQANALLRPLAEDMINGVKYTDAGKLEYDPAAHRFTFSAPDLTRDPKQLLNPARGLQNSVDMLSFTKAQEAVSKMNNYLEKMQPITEGNSQRIEDLLNNVFIGQDFKNIQKDGSFLSRMRDVFYNAIAPVEKPVNKKVPIERGPNGLPLIPDTSSVKPGDLSSAEEYIKQHSDKPLSLIKGMNDKFTVSVASLLQSAPPEIRSGLGVFSAFRGEAHQAELWKAAVSKYGSPEAARRWVAPPGHSMHGKGLAADLSYNGESLAKAPAYVVRWLHDNAGKHGLVFPLSNENWHVELAGARKKRVQTASN